MRALLIAAAAALPLMGAAHADWRNPSEDAIRLAKETIILDGHIDIPYRIQRSGEDISVRTDKGDFDYVRAMEGGLDAPFMAIYVGANFQRDADGGAKEQADALIDLVRSFETNHPDKFAVATSTREVKKITKAGKIALPMGMENGAPVGDDLDNVDYFYERGVRYMGLAHSKANLLSDSSYDVNRPHGGLSPLGVEVVKRMNDVGIIVDVSHVSDEAFYDIMETTRLPAIASHSSARKYTPGFERNMDDDMIKALGENGGVIMINYGSSFLTQEFQEWNAEFRRVFGEYITESGQEFSNELMAAYEKTYRETNPKPFADVDVVLDHIDHAVALAGINHVGLGSDYDGVGDSLPTGLKDASTMPNLVQGLMDRGYSKRQIRKILSGNAMRVWRKVERGRTR